MQNLSLTNPLMRSSFVSVCLEHGLDRMFFFYLQSYLIRQCVPLKNNHLLFENLFERRSRFSKVTVVTSVQSLYMTDSRTVMNLLFFFFAFLALVHRLSAGGQCLACKHDPSD